MKSTGRWLVFVLAVATGLAGAATLDARGWQTGTTAANTAKVLGPVSETPIELALPASLAKRITSPTLLFYFSPSCPHCVSVAPEVGALAKRLAGKITVIGVAAGGTSTPAIVSYFKSTHGWDFEVLRDEDRAIGAAMGAQSTPSALLVERVGSKLIAKDIWYPYSAGTDVLVEMRASPGDPFAPFRERTYVGPRACAACHVQEEESWLVSHHSIAWGTLVRGGHDTDAACVNCHVTGAGQPGGWTPDGPDALVDVGCEACHGPGGPHDGTRTEPRTTCEGCHDKKHSIHFSYEKGLPLLDHFRTQGLDIETLRAERRALMQGEGPRALLAFDGGERVGAAACASCHAEAHTQWGGTKHPHAMNSLVPKGAQDDPACVACHATARTSGPRPTTLEGYRTDEGVGCESCHGPGGAHVAAKGGTDNIVGLGASCPVCVIEAVCTSCHTATWDPDWDLDRDLPRVGHTPKP